MSLIWGRMSFRESKTCPPMPASRVSGAILDFEDACPPSPLEKTRLWRDDRFSNDESRKRTPAVVRGGGQTSFLILLLLLPLSCNRSDDNTDTEELVCSDDDPFDIDECPDSYPDLECTVYVDGEVESSGDGWSWDSAVKTVQEGVDLAHCGAEVAGICAQWEVWVKKGTYYIHKGCREHSVRMREKTALLGGFDGTESNEWDRDWEKNITTLSGWDSEAETSHVFHVVRGSDDTTIDGFTITGGRADDEGWQSVHAGGGGMSNYYASPTVSHCIFENNYAVWGSAIESFHATGSNPTTISECIFRDNTASYGTISNAEASLSITDTVISGNFAIRGGGIHCEGSEISVERCVIEQNLSTYSGSGVQAQDNCIATINDSFISDNWSNLYAGAIMVHLSHLTLDNSTLSGNTSDNLSGALHMWASSGSIQNSVIAGNTTAFGGGGALIVSSEVGIDSVRFVGNTAEWGGGACIHQSDVSVVNSEFQSNQAEWVADSTPYEEGRGGAIQSAGSNTSITNCSFYGNEATLGGSAVHSTNFLDPKNNNQLYEDTTTIINTILWGNGDQEIGWDDGEPVVTYSDVLGGYTGDGNINADPQYINAANGDLHLQAGSPCIGAADPAAAPETDIEGNVRDGEPDMGAYEY